jgi:hypothetical protein
MSNARRNEFLSGFFFTVTAVSTLVPAIEARLALGKINFQDNFFPAISMAGSSLPRGRGGLRRRPTAFPAPAAKS